MRHSVKNCTWTTLVAALLVLQGCSSSSSSSSSTTNLDATSAAETSDLLASLDALLEEDSSSTSSKLMSHKGEPGDFSIAGCNYDQERSRARQELGRISVPLCFIGAAESSGALVIPEDSYGVFEIVAPDGSNGGDGEGSFRIRMGLFSQDGKKTLKFQGCKGPDANSLQQTEHFAISEIDGGITVATQHSFSDSHDSMTFTGSNSIKITAKGTKDSLDSASLQARFSGSDGTFSQLGNVDFDHDKTNGDSIAGCFDGGGNFSHSGCSCTVAKGNEGATHIKGTDTFPSFSNPMDGKKYCPNGFDQPPVETTDDTCTMTFDGQQAFEFDAGKPIIVDSANSAFIDLVADCNLDKEPSEPDTFDESWDCSGDATVIDFTNINADECVAMEEKKQAAEEKLHDNCFFQEQEEGQNPPV